MWFDAALGMMALAMWWIDLALAMLALWIYFRVPARGWYIAKWAVIGFAVGYVGADLLRRVLA